VASLAFPAQPAAAPLTLLDVPFISQSEALCGGAAVAMVLRYWGETRVSAEDFESLVDRDVGGIRTAALVSAVRDRGSTALAVAGTAALAQGELAAGRPVIALIEDRPGALHYVVIVGWHERAVVLHDPARTPYIVVRPAEFERTWKVSGNWMLAIAPASRPLESTVDAPIRTSVSAHERAAHEIDGSGGCEMLVADGVRLAQQNDLTNAERVLADAAYRCPGAAPLRELAGVRLLQRRWPEVRELAGRAADIDPTDAHTWRLLATSRYVIGDVASALDAWNHAGEPVLDLVSASGLHRTTHRTVERMVGLKTGEVLTRGAFERGRRRLEELPALLSARLEYVPRGSGRAEVRAHVAEQPLVPRGRLTWAFLGARSLVSREVAVGINSLARGGERLEVNWRFWPHRPAYGMRLATPAGPLGIFTIAGFSQEQPFTDATVADARRKGARVYLADWATGALQWELRGGIDRWSQQGTYGVVGAGTRLELGRGRLTVGADTWFGDTVFATAHVGARWRSSAAYRGIVAVARGSVELAGVNTPLDLWPAGDTGHVRAALLRAHPLIDEGRIDVARLGRQLAQASGELQRWWPGPGPLAAGIAIFVDTARTGHRHAANAMTDLDAGFGLRVAVPGHPGIFRIDFGHGLGDGRNALSVTWEP